MIIDTHVWLSEPNSWGDLTMMDDAMIAAAGPRSVRKRA